MKIFYRFTVVPLIASLVLIGCKNDEDKKSASVQNSSTANPVQNSTLVFNKQSEQNMMQHLQDFQTIAMNNGGNRAVGTSGGEASAKYILEQIEKAGFNNIVKPFTLSDGTSGRNILAEIPGQLTDSIIVIGSHFDSVKNGPGINDNASGVSVLLELMRQFSQSKIKPKYTIQLAFWDAEERGIRGAEDYVKNLSEPDLKKIKAYINADMVGSKFPFARITDTNKSSFDQIERLLRDRRQTEEQINTTLALLRAIPSHTGDEALETSLRTYFREQKIPIIESISMIRRTDSRAFIGKVPVVGFGLVNNTLNAAGQSELATCYHRDCDAIELIDSRSLSLAGNAIVHVMKTVQAQ